MVKAESMKKSELIAALSQASTSRECNKIVRILKKFDPQPKKDLDVLVELKQLRMKEYDSLQAYMCYRCDKVKQSYTKGSWNVPKAGTKSLCLTCYNSLFTTYEFTHRAK